MSNFIFNNAKGKVAYYASLPLPNDGLVAIPLQSAGIEDDSTMIEKVDLTSVLTISNEQTSMGRKVLSNVNVVVDNDSNQIMVDADDFVYVSATGQPISCFIICYSPDISAVNDNNLIPLTKHDFSVIPNNLDVPVQISSTGLFVARSE